MDSQGPLKRLRRVRLMAGLVTGIFVAVAAMLAGLVFLAVYSMTISANTIDNNRTIHAAQGAVTALMSGMAGAIRDNSVWDDAYVNVLGDDAANWAAKNWGYTSENYPLYNVSAVISPANEEIAAYKDGVPFVADWYFDPAYHNLIERSRNSDTGIVTEFLNTKSGISLIGAGRIRPTTASLLHDGPAPILIFSKEITPAVLDGIAQNFDLPHLRLADMADARETSIPLVSGNNTPIGYLIWETKKPGDVVYSRVRPLFILAIAILILFLTGILVAGQSIVKNLKANSDRSQYRATHDALSGLLNRAGLLESMTHEIESIKSGSGNFLLYLLDLDGFKAVNDIWGHAVGDELIGAVAAYLKHLSPRGALVARLGGDEFAIGLRQDAPEETLSKAILTVFQSPFQIRNLTIEVGVSIGITQTADDKIDTLELVRQADVALYRAKEGGRGRSIAYSPDFDAERMQQIEFEDKLRAAIANRSVEVHFQPLFHAQSRNMTGVEALARWTLPTGRVAPDVFIPLAERAGLIDALGALVLSRALDAAQLWPSLEVSVNVSPLQLRNPTFVQTVKDIINAKMFDPTRLILEITENVLVSFPEQAKRSIDALRAIGVKFALDDFGCGYASLGALKEFHFDRMKIDRSLVQALDETADGANILYATVSLANALHVPVTAEGIETEEQAQAVTNSGCDVLQGYLLARPMSASDVTAFIHGNAARKVA